jgi:hypothetical protein
MNRIRYDELATRPASPDALRVAETPLPIAYGPERVLRIQNLGLPPVPTYGSERLQRIQNLLKCTS